MNPMTNVKNVLKLSAQELGKPLKTSWHDQYKDSAWLFIGGLPYDLTEGDVICVFSQYGEVVNINLVRDKITGKQKGFCFLCYEDQRSTVLAVDNLNGIKILGRTIRVDHVSDYKAPQDKNDKLDAETKLLHSEGCAPISETIKIKMEHPVITKDAYHVNNIKKENHSRKKSKKEKRMKKSKKRKTDQRCSSSSSETSEED